MSAQSEIETYRKLFAAKYAELDELFKDLPQEALLWKPFDGQSWKGECNGIGFTVAHAVSSTVYLLRRAEWVAGRLDWGQVDGDEGPNEFSEANHDLAYLQARVQRTYDLVNQSLERLSGDDLGSTRPAPNRADRVDSARYLVVHALEHLSQHIGEAHLTRQLWEVDDAMYVN